MPTVSRTSFRAASASASALPARLPLSRSSSCATSRFLHWTSRIQSQVINLLKELQEKLGLTYMFIAHDLNIVKYISDRIAVMYLGNLVELAPSDDIYAHTLHPYSQALLASVPIPDPNKEAQKRAQVLSGDVPSPINPKPGCKFAGRCPHATDRCRSETPVLREVCPTILWPATWCSRNKVFSGAAFWPDANSRTKRAAPFCACRERGVLFL